MDECDISRISKSMMSIKLPEAPKWAPFGEWAWAKYREGVPEEPDNDLETEVYRDIKSHFASNHVGLPITTANLLFSFMALGWYKPVLHPPPYERLYRGIKLRGKEALSAFTGIDSRELSEAGSMSLDILKSIDVTNGYSTSWTSKKQISRDFSEKGERGYAVTLIAKVSDNEFKFLAGPGGLYDVEGLSSWHLEKETVGLEPINVSRIEWERL